MTEENSIEQWGYRKLVLFLSSNGGLGYAPIAPGTFGTLAGIPAFYYLSYFSWPLQFLTLTALLFLSFWVSDVAGKFYQEADDGRIVIDELIGYLITTAFLPFLGRQRCLDLSGSAFLTSSNPHQPVGLTGR